MNFVWSGIFLWLCPDSPKLVKFLTEDEKAVLIKEVATNNQGLGETRFKRVKQLKHYKICLYILLP